MNDILGGSQVLGLLSPELQQQAEQRARSAGLTNLGFALLQASQGQPGQRRPGLGQIIGQAGPVGMQAYQQSFDRTLQDMLRAQQIQDAQRKRQQQQRLQQALEGARTTRVSPTLGLGAAQVESPITQAEIEAFGPQAYMDAARTVAPTETFIDRNKMLSAIAEVDPQKYLELTKAPEETAEIRTLQALIQNPQLMENFLKVKSAEASKTTNIFDMGKGQQKLFEQVDVPIVQGFATSAASSGEFARTASQINSLLKGKGGGDIVKIGTDLARTLGIESDQVAAQDLANSLVVQLAPRMRAPGSGSTSDIEFKSYIAAVPSLSSSENGREIMAKSAEAFARRNAKLADYAKKLAAQNKLSFESIAEYDRSLGPVLGDDFYSAVRSTQPRPAPGGAIDFRSGQGGPF
jgi:hypothetical protein